LSCNHAHQRQNENHQSTSPRLMRLYRRTHYEVDGISFRVGRRCPAMDPLLRENRVRVGAFISAQNPRSRLRPKAWNDNAHRRLTADLRRKITLPGFGAMGRWAETHTLVFGSVAYVVKLAHKYRQNVIVILPIRRPVWLLSLPSATNIGQ
jgi:hypothetical protein